MTTEEIVKLTTSNNLIVRPVAFTATFFENSFLTFQFWPPIEARLAPTKGSSAKIISL